MSETESTVSFVGCFGTAHFCVEKQHTRDRGTKNSNSGDCGTKKGESGLCGGPRFPGGVGLFSKIVVYGGADFYEDPEGT